MEKFTLEFPQINESMYLPQAFNISPERDKEITNHLEAGKHLFGDTINIIEIVNHAVGIATTYEEAFYIIMKTSLSLGKSIEKVESKQRSMSSLGALFGAILGDRPSSEEDDDSNEDDDSIPSFLTGKA